MLTKQEFKDWLEDRMTEHVMELIENHIEEAKEALAASAGQDALADRFVCGMIQAYRNVLELDPDEIGLEEDETDEETDGQGAASFSQTATSGGNSRH